MTANPIDMVEFGALEQPAEVAIVGGCGHVGLALGIALAQAGLRVVLIDCDARRVNLVAAGQMPFHERGADELLPQMISAGYLRATTDTSAVTTAATVIVTVGTPVDEFLDPSIRTFDEAIGEVLDAMVDGQLLVLRSTVFPGVTERLSRSVRERRLQIDIAYCPERIAQGEALVELRSLPQIVGGVTQRAAFRAGDLFSRLGAKIIELTATEAELAKLFANAYRYINFAISNQFYMMASRFGADFSRIHEAVTLDYPRLTGFAKAGFAGGPCLLKDTMQLAAFNHNAFALGQTAMMVNEGLPSALVEMAAARWPLSTMTAGILGMAFKGNSDDARDSLAFKLRKVLTLNCRTVLCTDPSVVLDDLLPLETVLERADILFVGACHEQYRNLCVKVPLVDPFGFVVAGGVLAETTPKTPSQLPPQDCEPVHEACSPRGLAAIAYP